jgi:hypothetical protein
MLSRDSEENWNVSGLKGFECKCMHNGFQSSDWYLGVAWWVSYLNV